MLVVLLLLEDIFLKSREKNVVLAEIVGHVQYFLRATNTQVHFSICHFLLGLD